MATKLIDSKIKLRTKDNEEQYIAQKLGITEAEVDKVRTYPAIEASADSPLAKLVHAGLDKLVAEAIKFVEKVKPEQLTRSDEGVGQGSQRKAVVIESMNQFATLAKDLVLSATVQNLAFQKLSNLPRLPATTPTASKAEEETVSAL